MKKPTELLGEVLRNEGLYTRLAVERDLRVIEDRFEHEGMSFLTITLPVLCDALERGLSTGRISPIFFPGFKVWKRGGRLPGLLRGFFMRVFDSDGWLLSCPCIDSIRAIRQVTRLFKKVELPCSSARIKRAFERYMKNDQSVFRASDWSPTDVELLRSISGYLWSDLEVVSGTFYCNPGVFGSGATAEKYALNERLSIREWPRRAERSFPSSYHTSHSEDDTESFNRLSFIEECDEQPVRVVQVPKTLKTPRIISVEPSYMMLMQQSIAKSLMDYLESDRFPYNSIRFRDQSWNREMARVGSLDGSLATIDLSDASDLVGNDLVKYIFGVCPTFLEFIQDCRSQRAQLPCGTILPLRKFASQGSALCFPIESMCFFTLATLALVKESGKRLSTTLLRKITAKISVYGDDIIVPAETAPVVIKTLEDFGLRVNNDKSFVTGFFRESCGGDYYRGVDVTPTYCRKWDDTGNTKDPSVISAYVSLSNQLYWKGLWHVSQYIRTDLERRFGQDAFPVSHVGTGYLSYSSVRTSGGKMRWSADRSKFTVMALGLLPRRRVDQVRDLRAVMLGSFQSDFHSQKRMDDWGSIWRSNRPMPGQDLFRDQDESLGNYIHVSYSSPPDTCGGGFFAGRLEHLSPKYIADLDSSVRPYALKLKRKWFPVNSGMTYP